MDNKNTAPKENKMGTMPIAKLLFSMAVPMMISMLVQAFYNVVDSFFVAKLSEYAFNSISLAFPLQNLMIAFGGGTAVGMNAILSRALGAKEQDAADKAANTGIFLAVCNYVVFMLIGILFARKFFELQTDVSSIVSYGESYTSICLCFSFGIFFQFCFERLLQSTGRTFLAMCTQLIGAVINIVLDPILIFGLCGFPRLEVAGAAIATVTGQIIAAFIAIILNVFKNPDIHIKLREIRFHGETVKSIYQIGVPTIIMQSIGSIMTFGMNKILISFTTTATAVFGAYFKLQSFIFMPVFGLNNGMVPIIAYNYGAKRRERVRGTIKLTIMTAIAIMFVGMLLFEFIPDKLLSIFNASDEMLRIGVPALRIIGTHYLLAGFCIIAGSVCQAIGNPVHSLTVSVCRQLVVLLPAAWLLSRTGNLTLIWLAFPIAELASLTLSSIFFARTMRRADKYMDNNKKVRLS